MASSPQAGVTPQDVPVVHPERVMDSNVGLQPENPYSFSAHQRRSGHQKVVQDASFHPHASDCQPWYDHVIQQRLQGQVPRVMPRARIPDMLQAPRHMDMRKFNPPMLYPPRYYQTSLTINGKDISVSQHNTSTPAVPTWNNSTMAYGAPFPQHLGRSWPGSFHDQIPTAGSRTFCNACNFSDIPPSGTPMPAVHRFPNHECFAFNSCAPLQFMRPLASSHLRALAAPAAGSQTVSNFSSTPEQRLVSSGGSTIKSVQQSELIHSDVTDIGKKTVTVELNGVRHVLEVPGDSPMLGGSRQKQAFVVEDTSQSVQLRNDIDAEKKLLLSSAVSGPTQPGSPVFVLSGGACQTTPTTKIPISAFTPCKSQQISKRQVKESHSILVSMLRSGSYSCEQEPCVDKGTHITDTSRTVCGKQREFVENVRKTKKVEENSQGNAILDYQTNSNINKMRNKYSQMKNICLKDVVDFTVPEVVASCHTGQGSPSENVTSEHDKPKSKGRKRVKRKTHDEPVPVKSHIKPETALKLKLKMKKSPETETKRRTLDRQNVYKKSYEVIKEDGSPLVTRRRAGRSVSVVREERLPKSKVKTRGRRSVLKKAESVTHANLKALRVVLRRVNLDGMTSVNIRDKIYLM